MSLQSYDYVKCEVCGNPWTEHTHECSNHRNRTARLQGFASIESSQDIAPILVNSDQAVPAVKVPEIKPKPRHLFFGLFGRNHRSI